MPITASGRLTIVASSDLGGLGARGGSPLAYDWVLPSFAPMLLPWLAILALLALKSNRNGAAWLIWLPVGFVTALTLAPLSLLPSGTETFLDAIGALAVGLAAVWLLSDHRHQRNRPLTFLSLLLTLAGFSGLGLISRLGGELLNGENLVIGIALGLTAFVVSLALILTGQLLRSRYRPLGTYMWLFVLLVVLWLVFTAPFFLFAILSSGGRIPWSEFFVPVLVVATITFATLLPFLLLSSASRFFRERLKAILHVKPQPPPLSEPLMEPNLHLRC